MKSKEDIYNKICNVLTGYENEKKDQFTAMSYANRFYDTLVEIQNAWEDTITAQEDTKVKKYKIYYSYTVQEAVEVEAINRSEAIDKFWDDDYLGIPERIMGADADVQIEEIHDEKGEVVTAENDF